MGNGAGTFTTSSSYTTGNGPRFVSVGDFNGDGRKDVACVNYFATTISTYLGTGTGSLVSAANIFSVQASPNDLSIADFNGDGKPDVVAANQASASISILLNSAPTVTAASTTSILCQGSPATITAATATTYTWNTGANTASILVSPTVTTNYTIVGTDGAGCQGGSRFTQSVQVCPLGIAGNISSENKNAEMMVYPNPFTDYAKIKLILKSESHVQMSLYNSLGQIIDKSENELYASGTYFFDVNATAKGIYFLVTNINGVSSTQKLIHVD